VGPQISSLENVGAEEKEIDRYYIWDIEAEVINAKFEALSMSDKNGDGGKCMSVISECRYLGFCRVRVPLILNTAVTGSAVTCSLYKEIYVNR